MICTFGDVTDVVWWRELGLPVRAVIQPNGAFKPSRGARPAGSPTTRARAGGTTTSSRASRRSRPARIVELLLGVRRPARRPAADHACREVLREGGSPARDRHQPAVVHQTMEFREALLARGREMQWHPPYMRRGSRTGSTAWPATGASAASGSSACRSRSGTACARRRHVDYDARLLPAEDRLPIDPSTDVPDGYTARAARPAGRLRRRPGRHGHLGDLVAHAADRGALGIDDPDLFARVFPMDLRPQAHDIIRTWLFSTVLRSHLEHDSCRGRTPRSRLGRLDPDRKKMSKSKGNVVTPARAARGARVRRRAVLGGRGAPGADTTFDPAR
jgi:valyl-tRNA synthetase